MPSTLSRAATKCISEVPGLVKHTLTPPATSVRARLSAPFIPGLPSGSSSWTAFVRLRLPSLERNRFDLHRFDLCVLGGIADPEPAILDRALQVHGARGERRQHPAGRYRDAPHGELLRPRERPGDRRPPQLGPGPV